MSSIVIQILFLDLFTLLSQSRSLDNRFYRFDTQPARADWGVPISRPSIPTARGLPVSWFLTIAWGGFFIVRCHRGVEFWCRACGMVPQARTIYTRVRVRLCVGVWVWTGIGRIWGRAIRAVAFRTFGLGLPWGTGAN